MWRPRRSRSVAPVSALSPRSVVVAAGPDGTKGFAVKRQRLWTMNVKPPPLEMPVGEVTVADRLVRRHPPLPQLADDEWRVGEESP